MAKIINNNTEYEITNVFPKNYIVWNLGRSNFNHEGYIPLCELNGYTVNSKTLKALKVDDERLALHVMKRINYGEKINKDYFEELVKNYNK